MNATDRKIWRLWTEEKLNTAEIAKAVKQDESYVYSVIRALRDEAYERQMSGDWLK